MDILLIEDDLRMAELISIGLRDNGHNVRLATDEIDGYMQYIAIHPLKQNFQCLKARYKKKTAPRFSSLYRHNTNTK
ncbi:MAG: hypothetical protein LRY45_05760 [Bacteroides graminisolvens]|nr:hypothetical protein [Bacteroides graminisolvens]